MPTPEGRIAGAMDDSAGGTPPALWWRLPHRVRVATAPRPATGGGSPPPSMGVTSAPVVRRSAPLVGDAPSLPPPSDHSDNEDGSDEVREALLPTWTSPAPLDGLAAATDGAFPPSPPTRRPVPERHHSHRRRSGTPPPADTHVGDSGGRGPARKLLARIPTTLVTAAAVTLVAVGVLAAVPLSTRHRVLALFRGGDGDPFSTASDGAAPVDAVGGAGGGTTPGDAADRDRHPPCLHSRLGGGGGGGWAAWLPRRRRGRPAAAPLPAPGVTVWAPDRSACTGRFVWGPAAAVRLRDVVPDRRAASAAEAAAARPASAASVRYLLLLTTVMPTVLVPSWVAGEGGRGGNAAAGNGSLPGRDREVWLPRDVVAANGGRDDAEAVGGAPWGGSVTLDAPIKGVGVALDHLAHTGGARRNGRDEWTAVVTFFSRPGGRLTSTADLVGALASAARPRRGGQRGRTLRLALSVAAADEPSTPTAVAHLAVALACATGWEATAPPAAAPRRCRDPRDAAGGAAVLLCSNALYGRLAGADGPPAVAAWAARALRGPASFDTVAVLYTLPVGLTAAREACALAHGIRQSDAAVAGCVAAAAAAGTAAVRAYAAEVGAALTAAGVPPADHHRLVVAPWCGLGAGPEEALVGKAGTASATGGGCSSSYMVAQFGAQYALYALLGGGHAWAAGGDVDEFLGAGVDDRVALPRGPAGALLAGALSGVPARPAGSPPDYRGGGRGDGALLAPWLDFRLAPEDRGELTRRVVAGAPLRLDTGGGSCASPAGQGKPGLHCAAGVAFSIHDVVVVRPGAGGGLAGAVVVRPPPAAGLWTMHARWATRFGACAFVGGG
ncbi:hypothetical protein BU14_0084s0026 [Porphyra umbilicalis]|uniref:Uncharacterized protein n=1 Tax=Porphyra umbilicalis TaxID=2786 RepID=A0A1X6PEB4_PORUM|nr:hypothetical protein BU14_0084s0026 [Porphyra umbilicalis]|eukprot:OSX79212.1 hypothetical protein BU14_0084s0026 [Porphyra umbilicalis]